MSDQYIIEIVASVYGVTPDEITGDSRKKPLPEARRMVCFIVNPDNGSKGRIARSLQVDSSMITSNIEKIKSEIRLYSDTRSRYEAIKNKLATHENKD